MGNTSFPVLIGIEASQIYLIRSDQIRQDQPGFEGQQIEIANLVTSLVEIDSWHLIIIYQG